jgi:putative colanic acid biosynthesis acetyltransferase WcaF
MDDVTQGQLDIASNRKARKWTRKQIAGRILWAIVYPIFSLSPRPIWGIRCWLLRLFGAQIGAKVQIHPSVRITVPWNLRIADHTAVGEGVILYALGLITLGERVTVSQYAHLCAGTHDHTSTTMDLICPPINIGSDAWICAGAFVGPGVSVGEGALVGARSVAVKNIPPWTICAGNPARPIRKRKLMQ